MVPGTVTLVVWRDFHQLTLLGRSPPGADEVSWIRADIQNYLELPEVELCHRELPKGVNPLDVVIVGIVICDDSEPNSIARLVYTLKLERKRRSV
jgi:hypothetical protein